MAKYHYGWYGKFFDDLMINNLYSRKYIWWWVWRRLGYRKRKWCWLALWRSKFQPRVRKAPQGDCQAKIVKKATKCDSIHEGSSQYWWWSRSYSFSKFFPKCVKTVQTECSFMNDLCMTFSGQIFAICVFIFHKTEVLTVILMCLTGLNLGLV